MPALAPVVDEGGVGVDSLLVAEVSVEAAVQLGYPGPAGARSRLANISSSDLLVLPGEAAGEVSPGLHQPLAGAAPRRTEGDEGVPRLLADHLTV